jgi:hypothetical protein
VCVDSQTDLVWVCSYVSLELPHTHTPTHTHVDHSVNMDQVARRVAIIGGGVAGASALRTLTPHLRTSASPVRHCMPWSPYTTACQGFRTPLHARVAVHPRSIDVHMHVQL